MHFFQQEMPGGLVFEGTHAHDALGFALVYETVGISLAPGKARRPARSGAIVLQP